MFLLSSTPINKDDKILFTNMPKIKHLPNTKQQGKYIGPHTVKRVTESHVVISKERIGCKGEKKIPIHTVRPYIQRKSVSGKRKIQKDSEATAKKSVSPCLS